MMKATNTYNEVGVRAITTTIASFLPISVKIPEDVVARIAARLSFIVASSQALRVANHQLISSTKVVALPFSGGRTLGFD